MKPTDNNKDLRYQNIYRDKHNRNIYYLKRKKQGLVIPEEDLTKWQIFRIRFLIPLLFFVLIYNYYPTYLYYEIAATLALVVALEIYFRKIQSSYIVIENYQPDSNLTKQSPIVKEEKLKLIIRSVLYLVLAILLVATTLMPYRPDHLMENMILYGVAVFCLVTSYNNITILIKYNKK